MENKKKWLGILVMVLVFGMLIIGCIAVPATQENNNVSLNGVWDRGDIVVTVSGNTGTVTQIDPNYNRGSNLRVGSTQFRNISRTSNLRWSAQHLFNNDSYGNITMTMSADGRTLRIHFQGFPDDVYTRVQ